ncbi:MAG: hypothetical protein QOH95_36 [Gaiellaceae bacterium]|jgi:hypothetical protein|nr:hypothetical protein [Gaiellaceae bacterium]
MRLPACPRCGSDAWNTILNCSNSVSFGGSHVSVACTVCNAVGVEWTGIDRYFRVGRVRIGLVHLERSDLELEQLPDEAVRVTHGPSGIVVEATAYDTSRDNFRAALQAIGLQLLDREQRAAAA